MPELIWEDRYKEVFILPNGEVRVQNKANPAIFVDIDADIMNEEVLLIGVSDSSFTVPEGDTLQVRLIEPEPA